MAHFREGSLVSYVGRGDDGRVLGERGKILSITGRCAHVKWGDDTLTLVALEDDILPLASVTGAERVPLRDDLADSLAVGPMPVIGLRQVFDTEGSMGVLNELSTTGQLDSFSNIADDVRAYAEKRIRQEPVFVQAATQFDDDETEGLVTLATHLLLHDAFDQEDAE